MDLITIQKIPEGSGIPPSWLDKLLEFSEQVRQKAFELFEESGRPHGHDVNHWLEAEKQLLSTPRYELLETANSIDVCIEIPGFDAEEIEIVALSDALLVKADADSGHEKRKGDVRYSEFNDQTLFRRIPLPSQVDVTRVTAKLDKGILDITAPKIVAEEKETCRGCPSCEARSGGVRC